MFVRSTERNLAGINERDRGNETDPCYAVAARGIVNEPVDDRSRQAIAYQWASQIISVSLEMVVPGLVGYWLDQRWGTGIVLTLVGFFGGMVLGMLHLLQLTRVTKRRDDRRADQD